MTFTEPAAEAAGDAACGTSRRFRGGLDVGHGAAAAGTSQGAAHGPKGVPGFCDERGMPTPLLRGHVSRERDNMPSERRAGHATRVDEGSP